MTSGKPRRKKSKATAPEPATKARARSLRYLSCEAVEALHQELLAEHGGLDGIRDRGLLESALSRCKNKAGYAAGSTVAELAASLAFGLAKNHPFNDGNKRIALIASFSFAELNGLRLKATEADAYETFMSLAAGELSEAELAKWFGAHSSAARARR